MAIAAVLSFLQHSITKSPLQSLTAAAFIVPVLYIIINEFVREKARVSGLKGPRGLPIIGNLAQIRKNAAEQYRIWSRTYGPVYQIQLGNIPVVVVNSAAAAKVLFGQNAQALSSRPEFYTFHRVSPRPYTSSSLFRLFFPLPSSLLVNPAQSNQPDCVEHSRYNNRDFAIQ